MSAINVLLAYRFIKLLTAPFEEWDAFKLGLIDKDGKSIKQPKKPDEKKALGVFQRLVKNIKRIIAKAPLGKFQIASLAIALKLLKEETGEDFEEHFITLLEEMQVEISTDLTLNENNSQEEYLKSGTYTDESGGMFRVAEDLSPVDRVLGVNLYEVKNIVTLSNDVVARASLQRM